MDRELLLKKTVVGLLKLPDQKIQEVADFAEFLLAKTQAQLLTNDIQKPMAESATFKFLEEEPELYFIADIKKR